MDRQINHVLKRRTPIGRWMPVALFSINIVGVLGTAIAVDAAELLHLAAFPLVPIVLYVWRAGKWQH